MLYHKDLGHLGGNLLGLLIFGIPVFNEFGPKGVYAIFFGSGVFAAIQRKDIPDPVAIRYCLAKKNPFPQSWRLSSSLYEKLSFWCISLLPSSLKEVKIRIAGCSAGVYGLQAVSGCMAKNFIQMKLKGQTGGRSGLPWKVRAKFHINIIFFSIIFQRIIAECRIARQLQGLPSEVGHSEHVSGMNFGFASYVFFTVCATFGKLLPQ